MGGARHQRHNNGQRIAAQQPRYESACLCFGCGQKARHRRRRAQPEAQQKPPAVRSHPPCPGSRAGFSLTLSPDSPSHPPQTRASLPRQPQHPNLSHTYPQPPARRHTLRGMRTTRGIPRSKSRHPMAPARGNGVKCASRRPILPPVRQGPLSDLAAVPPTPLAPCRLLKARAQPRWAMRPLSPSQSFPPALAHLLRCACQPPQGFRAIHNWSRRHCAKGGSGSGERGRRRAKARARGTPRNGGRIFGPYDWAAYSPAKYGCKGVQAPPPAARHGRRRQQDFRYIFRGCVDMCEMMTMHIFIYIVKSLVRVERHSL
jgi:hypothetical protein